MPLGPRPEPPRVPKKEPVTAEYLQHLPLAYQQPAIPPKTPIGGVPERSPYQNHRAMPSSASVSSLSSISTIATTSSTSSRLKGPRPLSSARKPVPPPIPLPQLPQNSVSLPNTPSKLPYPISVDMPEVPSPASATLPKTQYPYTSSELRMPEPFSNPPVKFPSPTYQPPVPPVSVPPVPSVPQVPSAAVPQVPPVPPVSVPSVPPVPTVPVPPAAPSAPSVPAVPSVSAPPVPPVSAPPPPRKAAGDLVPTANYQRPTKSIFRWGIPSELLPPMPVPVDAIGGLQLGNEGHYTMNIDLPEIPPMEPMRPRFSAEELTVADFLKLEQIWSVSEVMQWVYNLVIQYDAEIKIADIVTALTKLFMYRVPALQWSEAEKIASSVVDSLMAQKFIDGSAAPQLVLHAEAANVGGVITLLSGRDGCYSNSSPFVPTNTCCYSLTCLVEPRYAQVTRVAMLPGSTKRKVSLRAPSIRRAPSLRISSGSGKPIKVPLPKLTPVPLARPTPPNIPPPPPPPPVLDEELFDPFSTLEMNWRKYWHLEQADLSNIDPQLIKMQFAYHELVMSEIAYVRDLRIYLDVYADIELLQGLSVMNDQEKFSERVFDRIRAILKTNERLLANLLAEHTAQGPYIHTLGRWLIDWAQSPETIKAYEQYSDDYLWADNHLRKELSTNPRIQKWMEERAKDPRLTGRPHSFFFHRVLPRVARYHLLLSAILKYTPETAQFERKQITESIEACNKLTQACDDHVAKQKEVMDVQNVKAHIVFKSSAVTADLKLSDKRRKLIRRGNLIRKGDMKMEWVDTHALLLDNFFVMSKTREGMNGTALYVTKPPIPLDLLVLESVDEDAVTKVSSRLTIVRHAAPDPAEGGSGDGSLGDADNSVGNSSADTSLSESATRQNSAVGPPKEEFRPAPVDHDRHQPLFPIRISHLGAGKATYVLFAPNRPERTHWVKAIIQAKQARAQLAFARSAEPLKFVKISDQFAYPESETPHLPVPIPDTPLHRAVGSTDSIDRVILRRKVNCMLLVGSLYIAGTDFGLWMGQLNSDTSSSGSKDRPLITWSLITQVPQRILKLEVLDSMNLLLVLCGDHNLMWFPLDQMIARGLGDKRRCLGVRLNQHRKVLDFTTAYHRGRVVLMYLQQGGMLKVIEPVRSRGAAAMSKLVKAGLITTPTCVDSFREIDRLLCPNDAGRITAFMKCLVLTTSKSFEWITLDTKRALRIPAGRTSKEMQYWGRPIKIIKMDVNQLLLCYESCYLICDAAGNIGIHPTTWFLDKISDCAYYPPYLIAFSQSGEFIEVRFVDEFPGRLVQIITGKDIKLLSGADDAILVRMAHPWFAGRQLLLQVAGNEIVRDTESTWYSSSSG